MRILLVTALCMLRSIALGGTPAKTLDNGYQLRIEHPKPQDRYRVMLQYPDGTEELIWNPPGGEIVNGKQIGVYLGVDWYGKIAAQKLSVVISGAGHRWWLRWDMNEKRQLPLIEFFGSGQTMSDFELLDGQSISFVSAENSDQRITLTVDDSGVLRESGRPWDAGYTVYKDNRRIHHQQPDLGGQTVYNDTPTTFPYEDTGKPATPSYTIDADGTRRPYSFNPGPPNFEVAKRVGPLRRDVNISQTDQAGITHKFNQITSVADVSDPAALRGGWLLWAGVVTVFAGFAVWLIARSRLRRHVGERMK